MLGVEKPNPPDFSQTLRTGFIARVRGLFDASESALALGYLVGDKTGMSEDMVTALRIVGLSHMVVTSGYHLSIIIERGKKFFGKISRATIIFGSLSLIFVFVSITGMSASIMRAGLMSILSLLFWYFGRKFHPARLLLYTATISLAVSPNYLTSVAWLLSFTAYFGIIFFAPVLTKFLYGNEKPNSIASSIIMTISAQLFCLPISIYNFGMVSLVGILAGLLITPTVPSVMLLTLLSAIVSIIKYPAGLLLKLHLLIIGYLSKIPWASTVIDAGDAKIFAVYLPLFVIFIWLKYSTHHDFRPRHALDKIPEYGKIYPC